MNKWIILSVLMALLSACSLGDTRRDAFRECNDLSEPDRSYCLEQRQDFYDAYQRERTNY